MQSSKRIHARLTTLFDKGPTSLGIRDPDDWQQWAGCKDMDVELFMTTPKRRGRKSMKVALDACAECIVTEECLADAKLTGDHLWIIRGGMMPNEHDPEEEWGVPLDMDALWLDYVRDVSSDTMRVRYDLSYARLKKALVALREERLTDANAMSWDRYLIHDDNGRYQEAGSGWAVARDYTNTLLGVLTPRATNGYERGVRYASKAILPEGMDIKSLPLRSSWPDRYMG